MKLYERFGESGFHTTILTTFGLDFDAYENLVLARLRGGGCHNNIVLADQRLLTRALTEAPTAPRSAGSLYSVAGVSAPGVFHAKLILQLGRHQGRLFVGSANATAAGLAGNLELVGMIECDPTPGSEQRLVTAGWSYLTRLLNRTRRALAKQLAWMEARTLWLSRTAPAQAAEELADGTLAAFLGTDGDIGILERFVDLVASESIEQLVVLSPYWDRDLSALKELVARLAPAETVVLIDRDRALFPGGALAGLAGVRLLDIRALPAAEQRFVHAKLIVARSSVADHVLFGSANCTIAALGRQGFAGKNEEACLYRCLPADSVLPALGLAAVIADGVALNPTELPDWHPDDTLGKPEGPHPGIFECQFDTLIWRPPDDLDPDGSRVELLKPDKTVLPCSLQRLPQGTGPGLHFQIDGAEQRPAMARIVLPDGTVSVPTLVTLVDALRNEVREARTKRVERILPQLDHEQEEGLWLLEVLDILETAEKQGQEPVSRQPARSLGAAPEEPHHRILSYEEFVAGRRLRNAESAVGRNSLAGTELSIVRAFLNRILALETPNLAVEETEDGAQLSRLFDRGDEVADGHDAIEQGEAPDAGAKHGVNQPPEQDAERKQVARQRADRNRIASAVDTFNGQIRTCASAGKLTSFELLRLRAMLTIVAAAGRAGSDREAENPGSPTSLQVVPVAGCDACWPRLLGRVLYAFFGGNKPAIRCLQIEAYYDRVPDDLIECWACCYWAVQACLVATRTESSLSGLSRWLVPLRERLYTLTGLTRDELLGDQVNRVMLRMCERFSGRLGLAAEVVMAAHRESAEARVPIQGQP